MIVFVCGLCDWSQCGTMYLVQPKTPASASGGLNRCIIAVDSDTAADDVAATE